MSEDICQTGHSKALSLHYKVNSNYDKFFCGFFWHLICNALDCCRACEVCQ